MFRSHLTAENGLFCLFFIFFSGKTSLTVSHHDKGPSGCFRVKASKKMGTVPDFYALLHTQE